MTEIAVVVFVAALVFAATRISSIGDALGRAVRRGDREAPPPPRPPSPSA